MSLIFEGLVNNVKKATNHAIRRDYPPEAGVELRGKEGEPSIAPASSEVKDENNFTNRRMPNGTYGGVRGQ
jgi:hypothetical protein